MESGAELVHFGNIGLHVFFFFNSAIWWISNFWRLFLGNRLPKNFHITWLSWYGNFFSRYGKKTWWLSGFKDDPNDTNMTGSPVVTTNPCCEVAQKDLCKSFVPGSSNLITRFWYASSALGGWAVRCRAKSHWPPTPRSLHRWRVHWISWRRCFNA